MASEFEERCKETARRFLQTVVVVDDGAFFDTDAGALGGLTAPTRRTMQHARADDEVATKAKEQSLNARTLVEGFSKNGLICSVVAPSTDTELDDVVLPAAVRADIVVLDWRMNDNGEITLGLVGSIVQSDAGSRLRLLAIYTGVGALKEIAGRLADTLLAAGHVCQQRDDGTELSCRGLRIVLYAKDRRLLDRALRHRAVSEEEMPEVLIGDFANMMCGLVPNLAVGSLAAVRESTHRLIGRLHSGLDPAYLTHRACLATPEESEHHMVTQIASQVHAIMEDAAEEDKPLGMDAIGQWLEAGLGGDAELECGGGRRCSRQEILAVLSGGWGKHKPKALPKTDGFRELTTGFSGGRDTTNEADKELAWMICFRKVDKHPVPVLQLGAVLRALNQKEGEEEYLLCMRPKCDCVRLTGAEKFLLLPLSDPRQNVPQIVLRVGGEYRRVSVETDMSGWKLWNFAPNGDRGAVVGVQDDYGRVIFVDSIGRNFEWLGELREEFSQRLVQGLSNGLARIGVNASEWLRREERLN